MALKFYYEWKDEYDRNCLVEIYDKEYSSSSIEVTAGNNPFVIEFPETDIVDNPVISSGAKLSFIYHGNESIVRDFFTNDIKRYKVLFYNDGSLFWSGYLNSEVYSEDYSEDGETLGLSIEIFANDGMHILDRLYFYDDLPDESTVTPLETILYCANKMELDLDTLYYSSDISIINPDGTPTFVPDIFTNTIISTSNYINEDLERESCRTALESVLKLYLLKIRKVGDNLYIYSVNQKASGDNIVYDGIDILSETPVAGATESTSPKEVLNKYYSSSEQTLNYDSAYNEQVVGVDTYVEKDLVPNILSDSSKFGGNLVKVDHNTSSQHQWTENRYDEHSDFDFSLTNIVGKTSYPINISVDPDTQTNVSSGGTSEFVGGFTGLEYDLFTNVYVQTFTEDDVVIKTKTKVPEIILTEKRDKIVLSLNGLFQPDIEKYLDTSVKTDTMSIGICLWGYIKIGGYFLSAGIYSRGESNSDYLSFSWLPAPSNGDMYRFPLIFNYSSISAVASTRNVAGNWIGLFDYGNNKVSENNVYSEELKGLFGQLTIPLPPSMLEGEAANVEFGIFDVVSGCYHAYTESKKYVYFLRTNESLSFGNQYDLISIKDFNLGFSEESGDSKKEIVATGDSSYKESAPSIDMILGTSDGITPLQRGAYMIKAALQSNPLTYSILSPTWSSDNYFEYNGSNYFRPEDIIVKTCVNNRFSPAYKIECDLKYKNIKETDVISFSDIVGSKFVFVGGELDCRSFVLTGTWKEIKEDI